MIMTKQVLQSLGKKATRRNSERQATVLQALKSPSQEAAWHQLINHSMPLRKVSAHSSMVEIYTFSVETIASSVTRISQTMKQIPR